MRYLQGFLICILIFGCKSNTINKSESMNSKGLQIEKAQDTLDDKLIITGDFDNDKKIDTLKESFISSINGKETNKYADIEYDSLVAWTIKKRPICRLISTNLTPLEINKDNDQLFGLSYLKNEGDIDNDGADEVGLVVDWADWSNVNHYRIYTYKENKWIQLFNFEIRDYDIDDLKNNKKSQGLLYRNAKGDLIAKTYDLGGQIEKKIKLKK